MMAEAKEYNPEHIQPEPHTGKPMIGITMGDPAGIGPEVIVKALADPEIRSLGRFIIYGLHESIDYAAGKSELTPFWFRLPHEIVGRFGASSILSDVSKSSL